MFFRFLVYNKFKLKNWKKLNTKQRVAVCQKIERIEAKRLRRPVYKVVIRDLQKGVGGTCVSSEKEILLMTNYFIKDERRFDLLSTLFHEGRHAYQFDEIAEKRKHCILSRRYWWKRNMQGYINIAESGDKISFYSMQPVERDAEEYACRRLRRFNFRYRKELDYWTTLNREKGDLKKDVILAKKELGAFYRIKIAWKNRQERKKNRKKK